MDFNMEETKELPTLASMKEEIIKTDKNTLTKYRVVEEKIDIGDLEIEKRGIEEQLAKVVDDKQLLEWARVNYLQPQNIEELRNRLEEINYLLEIK
jgi:hypothetical protein